MNIVENVKLALEGLRTNKMRTLLTMLGIIIGISSVIGIWTLGDSISNSVSKGFNQFGSNLVAVMVKPKGEYNYNDINYRDNIMPRHLEAFKERFKDRIDAYNISLYSKNGFITEGRNKAKVSVLPTNEGALKTENLKMLSGRFLEDKDMSSMRAVAVISDKAAKKIFRDEDVTGKEIEVKLDGNRIYNYMIVGVYKHEKLDMGFMNAAMSIDDESTNLYIPITLGDIQFNHYSTMEFGYYYFQFTVKQGYDVESTTKDVERFFNDNFYKDNEKAEIQTQTLQSAIQEANTVMGTVKAGIGAIAAISLIVGGIGVMNILLVSVTERTREIGIRKALGATNNDIRAQFIIESIIICIIGGAIGVILGGILGYIGSSLMKLPTLPSITSIAVSVLFSMFVGIFFGYYPSNKAAKLNPIDALRYE